MGLNIFKKRNRSRTIWIGGSLSIFSLFAWVIMLTGVSSTYTGDIYCDTECISYVNITSTYWRTCFADDFELVQTDPNIRVDVYVPARGKDNWRPFDSTKDCIERKNKYNYLPNRFKLVGHKSAFQTVKWNIDKFDIDPKWKGVNLTLKNCKKYENQTFYTYEVINPVGNITKKVAYKKEVCIDHTKVFKLGKKEIDTKKAKVGARQEGNVIYVDDMYDGNGDGICQTGETCCQITNKIECTGYNSFKVKKRLEAAGIQ